MLCTLEHNISIMGKVKSITSRKHLGGGQYLKSLSQLLSKTQHAWLPWYHTNYILDIYTNVTAICFELVVTVLIISTEIVNKQAVGNAIILLMSQT